VPFISEKDNRAFRQKLTPVQYVEPAGWDDTFIASASLAIDEESSYSYKLERDMYEDRKRNFRTLVDTGVIKAQDYIRRRGEVDYDSLAADLRGKFDGVGRPGETISLIKTDEELREERSEIFRKRRERNQSVIERGSGTAQFFGTASALMLDPVNLASFAIALPYGAAKSMSTLGRALYTARNEAAIGFAAEAAIQPFVFAHKNEIDSPYAFEDAVENIAIATGFAGGLGFVAGGVAGYFRNAREKTRDGLMAQPRPGEEAVDAERNIIKEYTTVKAEYQEARRIELEAKEVRDDFVDLQRDRLDAGEISETEFNRLLDEGEPVVAYNEAKRVSRETDRKLDRVVNQNVKETRPDLDAEEVRVAFELQRRLDEFLGDRRDDGLRDVSEIYATEYQKFVDGRVLSLRQANDNTIKRLEKAIARIEKRNTKLRQWIYDRGGLNLNFWANRHNVDRAVAKPKVGGFRFGFWRTDGKGLDADQLRELLVEDADVLHGANRNTLGPESFGADDAADWLLARIFDPEARAFPELTDQADDLRRQIDYLSNEDLTLKELEERFQTEAAKEIDLDIEDLRELVRTQERMSQPSRVPEDYDQPMTIVDVEETDIQVKSVERQILAEEGYSEAHDLLMAEYRTLPEGEAVVRIGDEDVNLNELVKEYEEQLAGLDELVECTRSA